MCVFEVVWPEIPGLGNATSGHTAKTDISNQPQDLTNTGTSSLPGGWCQSLDKESYSLLTCLPLSVPSMPLSVFSLPGFASICSLHAFTILIQILCDFPS